MALDSLNSILYEHLRNETLLQQEYQWNYTKDTLPENNTFRNSLLIQLKNTLAPAMAPTPCQKVCEQMPTPSLISSFFNLQEYSYPAQSMIDWPIQNSLLALPTMPIIVTNPNPIFTTLCPYTSNLAQPILPPIVQHYNLNAVSLFNYGIEQSLSFSEPSYCTEIIDDITFTQPITYGTEDTNVEINANRVEIEERDPIEFYLKLPRELFPAARMLNVDPNLVIDEFCKAPDLQVHIPWLLDLEFGIPKAPITRPIPIYNVKINSINCKNAPEAIHPGFESCEPDFKRILLFYYDCIVSAWYRGYVVINDDRSVENFQSWLVLPMQVLGMCWP